MPPFINHTSPAASQPASASCSCLSIHPLILNLALHVPERVLSLLLRLLSADILPGAVFRSAPSLSLLHVSGMSRYMQSHGQSPELSPP